MKPARISHPAQKQVVVAGAFDHIGSGDLRFLQEAAKLGELTVLLWPDDPIEALQGKRPAFSLPERSYLLNAVRYVDRVVPLNEPVDPNALPEVEGLRPDIWADDSCTPNEARRTWGRQHGVEYQCIPQEQLRGFPDLPSTPRNPGRKKVLVTGCYDWLHSGHIRFFEQVSAYGDLYVVIGHDANIRLLKGEGHPLLPQKERRYLVGSIRHVTQALISTGTGWLDAEPEIQQLKPDIYAVNEDGDQGGKREYCATHGIQYLVLKRTPAPGLPRRSSTELREQARRK